MNIGIAVDTERGLVVPVLRDADRKSISQIASELDELATHGARRQVRPRIAQRRHVHDQQPGLGRRHLLDADHQPAAGGDSAWSAARAPCRRSSTTPSCPRLMMPLSITYDHRLVDGAAAARFLNEVKSFLAAPGRLLLAP